MVHADLIETVEYDRERNQYDASDKQPPAQVDHHDEASNGEDHVADRRKQGIRGDALDLSNVSVESRDEISQPGSRMEARREREQMPIDFLAHVEQHRSRKAHVAESGDVGESEAEHGRPKHEDR